MSGVGGVWLIGGTVCSQSCGLIGFDADKEECNRLRDPKKPHVTLVPLALGSKVEQTILHLTDSPGCSSLYPPDASIIVSRPSLACARKTGEMEPKLCTGSRPSDVE